MDMRLIDLLTRVKPGVKSTEFWLVVALVLLLTFGPHYGLLFTTEQVTGLIMIVSIYVGGRSATKMAASFKPKGVSDETRDSRASPSSESVGRG